jgi:tetratricopeptide (TPR) repeat protein
MIYFQRDLKRENTRLKQQKKTLKHLEQDATLRWKAEVALNANQLDKAMAAVDEALKNDPHNDLALMTKARVLKRQAVKSAPPDRDKLKQAISFVDQAIALNPERGEPVYNKACYQALLGQTGLKDDVLENLRAAFRLNPDLRQIAKDEEDLVSLKQDADFVRLVGQDETPAA